MALEAFEVTERERRLERPPRLESPPGSVWGAMLAWRVTWEVVMAGQRASTVLSRGRVGSGRRRRSGGLCCWMFTAFVGGLGACSTESHPGQPQGEAPGAAPAEVAVPVEQRPAWVFPEGGVAVDAVPSSDNDVRAIDAHGNLWIRNCEGLYVANASEVRRYRYLDAAWERGGSPDFADQQGRVWYSSDRGLSVLEAGQWRDVPSGGGVGFLVGSDGVAWAIDRGGRSGDFNIRSVWPEASAPMPAPRWHTEAFAGQHGAIWYRTSLTSASELWHFDGERFSGPFTIDNGTFFYDSLDDTMGLVRWEHDELIKVRFDGTSIVEASRSTVDWLDALGRQSDGYLIARSEENEVLILDGERTLPMPELSRRSLGRSGFVRGKLNPTGELYLLTEAGVYHYDDGEARPVIEYARYAPEVRPWQAAGYGSALRAESTSATRADFEPEVPAIFGKKVRITGVAYHRGFDVPQGLAVDGEPVDIDVHFSPELSAFATERGLDPSGPVRVGGAFDASAEPWDMTGYLEPGPCYLPGDKAFHVIEAYPQSMPLAERAALEAELRERHAL